MIGIYKFTNKLTGESYIGQSVDIRKRYIQHKNRYDIFGGKPNPKENTYFHAMLRHYGFHNFAFEVLEECNREQLNDREVYYIKLYNSLYPNGYNKNPGGNMPHTMAFDNVDTVFEIKEFLRTSKLTNQEIGDLYGVSARTISDINTGTTWFDSEITYPIRRISRKIFYCRKCGKQLHYRNKNELCRDCYNEERSEHIPSADVLKQLLLSKSFSEIARIYGVSGKTIKKWCQKRGVLSDPGCYKSISV